MTEDEWKVKNCCGNGELEDYLNKMCREGWSVREIYKTDPIRSDFTVILLKKSIYKA